MADSVEEFSDKMSTILNYGALNLAMGIGYRLKLFDIMDSFERPRTSEDIAHKAGLNPRYVKEWLAVMVTGGIVDVSQDEEGENCYLLPKTHADFITRRAGNSNLGVYTQEIPLLTMSAMDAVVEGFHSGDGVGYDQYPSAVPQTVG